MKDWNRIHELETQIAQDEQRFHEIERLEEEQGKDISQQGFSIVSTEGRYRDEKETLSSSILRNREMLAGIKTQPD
jgi:hypothetical protein